MGSRSEEIGRKRKDQELCRRMERKKNGSIPEALQWVSVKALECGQHDPAYRTLNVIWRQGSSGIILKGLGALETLRKSVGWGQACIDRAPRVDRFCTQRSTLVAGKHLG